MDTSWQHEGQPSECRVLVVDDDASLLDALYGAFSEEKRISVTACSTFEDAKRHLHQEKYDALVTDIRLGAFNGLQLAVLAKDMDPRMRVVVFSGFDDFVLREEAQHIGATYLVKPVQASTLLELILDSLV